MKTRMGIEKRWRCRGVSFLAIFAVVLAFTATARSSLYIVPPDAGMLAGFDSGKAMLVEGTTTGKLAQLYLNSPEQYLWQRTITPIASNGLFRVDYWLYWVFGPPAKKPNLSILLFRPPERGAGEVPFNQ